MGMKLGATHIISSINTFPAYNNVALTSQGAAEAAKHIYYKKYVTI